MTERGGGAERMDAWRAYWDIVRMQAVANREYSIHLTPEDRARPAGVVFGVPNSEVWVPMEWQDYWLPRRSPRTPQRRIPVLTTEAGETLAILASGAFRWGGSAYWRRKQSRARHRRQQIIRQNAQAMMVRDLELRDPSTEGIPPNFT